MAEGFIGCRSNPAGNFLGSFPKLGFCAATEGAGNKGKVSVCIELKSTLNSFVPCRDYIYKICGNKAVHRG